MRWWCQGKPEIGCTGMIASTQTGPSWPFTWGYQTLNVKLTGAKSLVCKLGLDLGLGGLPGRWWMTLILDTGNDLDMVCWHKGDQSWYELHRHTAKECNPSVSFPCKSWQQHSCTHLFLEQHDHVFIVSLFLGVHCCHTEIWNFGRCFKSACLGKGACEFPIVHMTKTVLHHHGIEPIGPPCSLAQPKNWEPLHHSAVPVSSSLIIYDELLKNSKGKECIQVF